MRQRLCGLLLLLSNALVCAADWEPYRAAGPTRVEYRHDDDKLLNVRAETLARSSAGDFLHLLEDTGRISSWAANTYRAELIERPAPRTHVVHTYFSASWPVSRRDMVTRSVWQQDADGTLTLQISDVGQDHPPAKGHVRMQNVQARWTLKPEPDGMLRIRYEGRADPAGKLPHFISDKVALKSLFETFTRLPEALQPYQHP